MWLQGKKSFRMKRRQFGMTDGGFILMIPVLKVYYFHKGTITQTFTNINQLLIIFLISKQ